MALTVAASDIVTLDGTLQVLDEPKFSVNIRFDEVGGYYRAEVHAIEPTATTIYQTRVWEIASADLVAEEANFTTHFATVVSAFNKYIKGELEALNPSATFTIV
jgi:hypothetical protein